MGVHRTNHLGLPRALSTQGGQSYYAPMQSRVRIRRPDPFPPACPFCGESSLAMRLRYLRPSTLGFTLGRGMRSSDRETDQVMRALFERRAARASSRAMESSLATEAGELDQRVRAFQRSVTPDVYSVGTLIALVDIDEQVKTLAGPISVLQQLVDENRLSTRYLGQALREVPEIAGVARLLFTAPHAVGFADGRELPESFDPAFASPQKLARLLVDLGLDRLLSKGHALRTCIGSHSSRVDSRRRGFRREADLEGRVEDAD